jgi:hypothetical protein
MSLSFEDYFMPAADMPGENPLFDFGAVRDAHNEFKRSPDMPDDVVVNPEYGQPFSILPYTLQDDYGREKKLRAFKAAVLENERLRATFIPALGGRLWSLFDKKEGRELLHSNPVFQPANLALRNAWFSGGIEFNISIIGHTPLTCSPLFVDRLDGGALGPVLRMYEYERVRGAVYRMDFCLPEGSDFLLARFEIKNMQNAEIPMYWWTNIAVDQRKDVRVVVPADRALHLDYEKGLSLRPFPHVSDTDASYATNLSRAMDFFFYIQPGERRFISAVGGDGLGFVQTSTELLKGRKLFVWGMGSGGERWQEYLSRKGSAYIEIQAGLGYSQMEYLKMPARGKYAWAEAYGPIKADPEAVSGAWEKARAEVGRRLDQTLPAERLDDFFRCAGGLSEIGGERVCDGSGWGALENLRRKKNGEAPLPAALRFDRNTLGEVQAPWLALIENGAFSTPGWPEKAPSGYQVDKPWRDMLEKYCETHRDSSAFFQLGVARYNDRDAEGAKRAWEESESLCPSAWTKRALALWEHRHGDREKAFSLYSDACAAAPGVKALAVEYGNLCKAAGRFAEYIEAIEKCPQEVREHPRVALIKAACLIELGRLAEGEAILTSGLVVPDIREGEVTTTELWYRIREKELEGKPGMPGGKELGEYVRSHFTPPRSLDFRMH